MWKSNPINENKISKLIRPLLAVRSCYIMPSWFLQVKQRRARLVRGWVTVTDRGLSRMYGFSARDGWHIADAVRKVGIVTSTLLSRVTEGWILYVSGLAIYIMSVGMTGRRLTGYHRYTRTASNLDKHSNVNKYIYRSLLWRCTRKPDKITCSQWEVTNQLPVHLFLALWCNCLADNLWPMKNARQSETIIGRRQGFIAYLWHIPNRSVYGYSLRFGLQLRNGLRSVKAYYTVILLIPTIPTILLYYTAVSAV